MRLLKQLANVVVCLLRELSDEGGYRRYLQQSGVTHSGETWRRYIDGRHRRKFASPKCC